ncbi:DUF4129 domain-containing protein [Alicyclobacillus mengziensis]|uniref:DUF4129 domain-containing protein n=1 Tax=Alicyclobacillus mengziensis TaxID=2931921 RepID=A0A9X7VWL9_9BACL|nr:DUF4129 domain-containing protein [Alicyclobacillus mengziensis]QSO45989.1 DUF4129 domain-containing protein [Alicyclobacillus mengziensis]
MSTLDSHGEKVELNHLKLPFALYWLLVFLTFPVPYVLYTTVLDSGQTAPAGWLLPFLFLVITIWVLGLLAYRRFSNRILFATVLLWIAAAELVWYLVLPHRGDLWVYPLLTLGVTYRLSRWRSAPSLSEENRISFVWEGVLAAVSTFFLLVTGTSGQIRSWLVLVLLIALILRLFAMWSVERLETHSHGARGNIGLIVVMVALVVWLGPKVLYFLVMVLVGGGAVLGLPLLYLLNAILPKKLFARSLTLQSPLMHLASQAHQQNHAVTQTHSLIWVLYLLYGLFVLLAIWLVWRMSKRHLLVPPGADASQGVTVHRQRVVVRPEAYIPTTHPIRQRYQAFLRNQEQEGSPIGPAETPREYKVRLEQKGESKESLGELTRAYEGVRYGNGESESNQKKPEALDNERAPGHF